MPLGIHRDATGNQLANHWYVIGKQRRVLSNIHININANINVNVNTNTNTNPTTNIHIHVMWHWELVGMPLGSHWDAAVGALEDLY